MFFTCLQKRVLTDFKWQADGFIIAQKRITAGSVKVKCCTNDMMLQHITVKIKKNTEILMFHVLFTDSNFQL